MIIHAEDAIATDLRVVDPATGEEIRDVTRADSETGELTVLKRVDGHLVDDRDGLATEVVRRPFRIKRISTGELVCEAA